MRTPVFRQQQRHSNRDLWSSKSYKPRHFARVGWGKMTEKFFCVLRVRFSFFLPSLSVSHFLYSLWHFPPVCRDSGRCLRATSPPQGKEKKAQPTEKRPSTKAMRAPKKPEYFFSKQKTRGQRGKKSLAQTRARHQSDTKRTLFYFFSLIFFFFVVTVFCHPSLHAKPVGALTPEWYRCAHRPVSRRGRRQTHRRTNAHCRPARR